MPVQYNEFLKAPNMEQEFTVDEIRELQKCATDIFHFTKHVKIVTLDKGKQTYKPYPFQKNLLEICNNNRFVISLCPRQSGKSVTIGVFALHYSIFNRDKFIGIVSNKLTSAKEVLHRIKIMYEELPFWLKPGVVEWNKESIEFDNGTRIQVASTAGQNSLRGRSINLLICDEFAFLPNNIARDFYASNYPAISASQESKIIIISTPNGLFNLFHELYSESEKGRNAYAHFFADWRSVPGRDEDWAKVQMMNLGEAKFNQEFGCIFLGSSSTVVNSDTLKKLFEHCIINPLLVDLEGRLKIWQHPVPNAKYVIGVDPAKGTGKDFSVAQILRIDSVTPIKCEQVATFCHNTTDTYQFAEIINRLSYFYNNATIMIENNAEGAPVVSHLWWTYENTNLFTKGQEMGIRATKKTKTVAVLLMKKLLEAGMMELKDGETIKQLASFVDEGGKFAGKDLNDDLVSALYWATYIFEERHLFDDSPSLINNSEGEVWGILGDVDNFTDEDWTWLNQEEKKTKTNENSWLQNNGDY